MKKFFYIGITGMILFEIANVYFIMPMPGSQKMNSIALAYFLHSWRWVFRVIFAIMALAGAKSAFRRSKILACICLLFVIFITWAANFKMAADSMFLQPKHLKMSNASGNSVDKNRLVLGIEHNGQAKAYPIQFLGYHHQVFDTVGGEPVIVTYCTVCRTGRVYEPVVNGRPEEFRLVGMDHFNAMFEDKTTNSWWRQATGEAIAGKLKGEMLPELSSTQMTLNKWLLLYPNSVIMQPDDAFTKEYQGMDVYESGKSKGKLTRKDSLPWKDKSWIAGIIIGSESKAYDWNSLQKERIIHDEVGGQPVVIILANDNKSFIAFKRKNKDQKFRLESDTLYDNENTYNFTGKAMSPAIPDLIKINVYQEYWHSWQSFHAGTQRN